MHVKKEPVMKTAWAMWRNGLICASALAAASVAYADPGDRQGNWETRLGIIFQNSADWDFNGGTTADIESDESILVGIGYHVSDQLELGGNMTFGQTDYSADIVGDTVPDFSVRGEYESTTLLFDATWNFLPGQFTPYASAIAGWSWIDTNIATEPPQTGCWWDPWWGYVCTTFQDTKSLDGFTYGVDVGARYDFSESFALRGGYHMMWVDLSNASGTPDQDGFELRFAWKF
jgi:opacity protein-like surface antigen